MKTGWTTHSWNGAIWLALSPCHMTMTCKINKLEKPGGPLSIFHTLFGRSAAFYGHFWVDTVTSEWSTRISSSNNLPGILLNCEPISWEPQASELQVYHIAISQRVATCKPTCCKFTTLKVSTCRPTRVRDANL